MPNLYPKGVLCLFKLSRHRWACSHLPLPKNLIPPKRELASLVWTCGALLLVACLVVYPQAVFMASQRGLKAWWEIVFPALLPFFIGTELLIGFGVVRFMGVLLEPVMRPLFNLPGAASFVVAVGFTSGFPIGSAITAQLRGGRTGLQGGR